jgi:tRNA1(Val) A37 N6-methylase TrmN6
MHNDTTETPVAFKHRGMTIVTDPPKSKKTGAVLSIYREAVHLIKYMKVPKGGLVLDMCTGSGIIALFAAKKAGKVIGTDINPRALSMARFNARINDVDKKVEFRQGDMFKPVQGMLFDLIVANPPLDRSKIWASGKSFTEFIIQNADKHLNPKGSLQIMCYIPDESIYLLDSLKERFRKVKVRWPGGVKNRVAQFTYKDGPSNEKYEYKNWLFIHAAIKKTSP